MTVRSAGKKAVTSEAVVVLGGRVEAMYVSLGRMRGCFHRRTTGWFRDWAYQKLDYGANPSGELIINVRGPLRVKLQASAMAGYRYRSAT